MAEELCENPDAVKEFGQSGMSAREAGWPCGEETAEVARVASRLVTFTRRERLGLRDALARLENVAHAANIPKGINSEQDATQTCVMCMMQSRTVHFACGHQSVCAQCSLTLER